MSHEALRLADVLAAYIDSNTDFGKAAAELSRQHTEIERLRALNAEPLASLLECVEDSEQAVTDYVLMYGEKRRPQRLEAMRETVRNARAAIAKAEAQ